MQKGIIILGNGFDLDLGLKTSYSSFAKSHLWSELMDNDSHSNDENWLLGFLKQKYQVEKWIDIEAALLEYAQERMKRNDFDHSEEDRKSFISLCNSLREYLLEEQIHFIPNDKSVASCLLAGLEDLSKGSKIYTFNYTLLGVLASKCQISLNHEVEHIHGSLKEGDSIILGIESPSSIDDRYAFLYKTQNRRYRHTDLLKDLIDKDEYVFFGHALNGMDYEYFRSTLYSLSIAVNKTPRLTIITKDEKAEEIFKNFLRNEHISLQKLFSNSIPTFILTDEINKGNKDEGRKVDELLNRLSAM